MDQECAQCHAQDGLFEVLVTAIALHEMAT